MTIFNQGHFLLPESHNLSGTASAAISPLRFVKRTGVSNGQPTYAHAGAGELVVGINPDQTPAGGLLAPVCIGLGMLVVNGASDNIAPGDSLKPTTGGIGIKASNGDEAFAVAEEAATTDGAAIRVFVFRHRVGALTSGITPVSVSDATATVTLAQASGKIVVVSVTRSGAVTLNVPPASTSGPSLLFVAKPSGSAGAVTITPSSGQVGGASTNAEVDASGDWALFMAITGTTNWLPVAKNITA